MTGAEEEKFKKVDEDWKQTVQKEKEKTSETEKGKTPPLKADFNFFISSLAMEAIIALGEMENPITKKKSTNLNQAQYLIDLIDMLKDKAKGNLTEEESNFIDNILSDLKMRYINKAK